ncbi:hypothetical protein FEM48_Zijuj03G0052700 [Ziziphus jujuba var. spinosa]|uniref:Uncharacterized protein n=1 Tax=Ziziphus jujuba var. spinosa TaxID=714518 RepID=A0A978VNE1_ZIZJJ|nr:hypothetical protein FEM48_Zijuj03G0052700 [Ziziphus jujuba var. spinosa]
MASLSSGTHGCTSSSPSPPSVSVLLRRSSAATETPTHHQTLNLKQHSTSPDRVKALVNLSIALLPRNPEIKFVEGFRALYGDDYYFCRFQLYVYIKL